MKSRSSKKDRLLDSLLKSHPDRIFFKDKFHRFVLVSRSKADQVGAQPEEMIGKTDFAYYQEEDAREKFRDDQWVLNNEEQIKDREETVECPDGTIKWLSTTKIPRYDRDGNLVGTLGISRDITERKKTEEQLNRYKMAVEGSDDLIAACDENYNYYFANQAYKELYDFNGEDITDKKVSDLVGEDLFNNTIKPKLERCLQGERIEYEMKRTHPELEERYLKITYYPLRAKEDIQGLVAVIQDITDLKSIEKELQETNERLKRSKERYQKYFEDSGDAIFILEMGGESHGRILDANSSAEEQTGYSREDLIGMNMLEELVADESSNTDYEEINEKLLRGESVSFTEQKRRKDGTEYWTEVVVTPIKHEGKQANLSINRDVTERIKAQQALKKEQKRLKELHDAVDRFQSCQSGKKLYETALEVTKSVLDFDISLIYVDRGDKLVPVASDELNVSELPTYEKNEALVGEVYTRGETVWGDDLRERDKADPEISELRSYMSVPIGDLGVFQAGSRTLGAFSEVDVELAEILAGHLNEEIKRITLEEELKEQSIRDPMTGLYNRRYLHETINKEIERSERYGHNIAFIMIDLNRFKKVNDTYSHQTGDEVLKEIANLLRRNVREADTVTRYGGDEFLIMLPETNGEAELTVERLKEKVEKWNDNTELIDFHLTLAIGLSHWNPTQDRSIEDSLQEADRKMYEEKDR